MKKGHFTDSSVVEFSVKLFIQSATVPPAISHAAVLLEQSLSAIERAAETMAKAPDNAPKRGEVGRGRGNRSDNVRSNKGGNDKNRLAARIKRDHPEIAARVANGEFKSIRAAALEAGIVKPMRSIPVDTPPEALGASRTRRPGWQ